MSLLEVLFVTALLGLFMTMVSRALILGYRAHVVTLEKTFHYREGTLAAARMLREISTCNGWELPLMGNSGTIMRFWRNNSTSASSGPSSGVLVEYTHDAASRELRLTDPLRTPPYKVVAREVDAFTVDTQTPNVVRISILIHGNNVPIVITGQINQL